MWTGSKTTPAWLESVRQPTERKSEAFPASRWSCHGPTGSGGRYLQQQVHRTGRIYNRLAIDFAMCEFYHAQLDDNDVAIDIVRDSLNDCLYVGSKHRPVSFRHEARPGTHDVRGRSCVAVARYPDGGMPTSIQPETNSYEHQVNACWQPWLVGRRRMSSSTCTTIEHSTTMVSR